MSIKFGIIGGGVMGEALLSRLIAQKIYLPDEVMVSDPQLQRQRILAEKYGVQVTGDNRTVAVVAEVLFLAIKPQMFDTVAPELTDRFTRQSDHHDSVIISILAGVTLQKLEAAFPGQSVIRAMPNTPATVGAGMTAIAIGRNVKNPDLELAHRLFQSVGEVVEVPETLMDAVTGLSGSGPGYVAILIEALADGGVYAGLPRPIAAQLALQTVLGTAQLLQASGIHPAELKDRVTSPGGTTIAGIAQLERSGFRSAVIEAVKAATLRSQELGS